MCSCIGVVAMTEPAASDAHSRISAEFLGVQVPSFHRRPATELIWNMHMHLHLSCKGVLQGLVFRDVTLIMEKQIDQDMATVDCGYMEVYSD